MQQVAKTIADNQVCIPTSRNTSRCIPGYDPCPWPALQESRDFCAFTSFAFQAAAEAAAAAAEVEKAAEEEKQRQQAESEAWRQKMAEKREEVLARLDSLNRAKQEREKAKEKAQNLQKILCSGMRFGPGNRR